MGKIHSFFKRLFSSGRRCSVSISSNIGRIRSRNEDNFFADGFGSRSAVNISHSFSPDFSSRLVFAVCDGMGGEAFGEEAAEIAVQTIGEFADLIKTSADIPAAVNTCAAEANRRICQMAEEKLADVSGCTLALAVTEGNTVYCFNIGDSRIYYCSGGAIEQLSEDHTVAMQKLRAKIYTEEEARLSEDAHRITKFLGVDKSSIGLTAQVCKPVDISAGRLILCSDGLTDMCSDEEILEVASSHKKHCAEALVERALKNGGADNVTCIVIG